MGIAALVLGIISFVLAVTFVLAPLGVVLAVIGLILGIVDTVKKGKSGDKKAISLAGMILSAVMFVVLMVESFSILIVGIAVYDYNRNNTTESLQQAEMEAFNTKFSGYSGNQVGSRVKVVLNNINISNNYSEHLISVYYNGEVENANALRQKISTTQKYTVTFYKDLDGYINRVYIIPNYSNTTNHNQL